MTALQCAAGSSALVYRGLPHCSQPGTWAFAASTCQGQQHHSVRTNITALCNRQHNGLCVHPGADAHMSS
jgi:hypothetical protein